MIQLLKEILLFYVEIAPFMVLGLLFVAALHKFISKDMIARHMGRNNILSAVKGAVLGVPLPLCSCGVVPSAVYFSKFGASKSSIVSFLISTPQTGVDSIIATYGTLGPVFAVFRPLAAFVSGIVGGAVTSFISKDEPVIKDTRDDDCEDGTCGIEAMEEKPTVRQSMTYAFVEFLDDIAPQFIFGVIIAGVISVAIPEDFFVTYGIDSGATAMALMIVVGIPMYVCATASIPIGLALLAKGISPGAVFVFLAVGPLTNAASLTILYRVLKAKMLVVYVASGTLFAVLFGILLDYIFSVLGHGPVISMMAHEHSGVHWISFDSGVSLVFAVLLAMSVFRKVREKFDIGGKTMEDHNSVKIPVHGMSCNHCKMTVEKAVSAVAGVTGVEVSLERKEVAVTGDADINVIKKAIKESGYSVE